MTASPPAKKPHPTAQAAAAVGAASIYMSVRPCRPSRMLILRRSCSPLKATPLRTPSAQQPSTWVRPTCASPDCSSGTLSTHMWKWYVGSAPGALSVRALPARQGAGGADAGGAGGCAGAAVHADLGGAGLLHALPAVPAGLARAPGAAGAPALRTALRDQGGVLKPISVCSSAASLLAVCPMAAMQPLWPCRGFNVVLRACDGAWLTGCMLSVCPVAAKMAHGRRSSRAHGM